MRSQAEVEDLIDKLTRFNSKINTQLCMPGSEFDSLAFTFNNNSTMLCALQWVMGENTIEASGR